VGLLSAQQVADLARIRHHSFTDARFPDGALMLEANQRLRYLYGTYADALLPLLGAASDVAAVSGRYPLPTNIVKLGAVTALDAADNEWPVDVVPRSARYEQPQTRNLQAYLEAGSLVPVRPSGSPPPSDGWSDIVTVRFYALSGESFTALTDTVSLHDVVQEAVVSHLARRMALASRETSATEKAEFVREAREAESRCAQVADSIVGDASESTVLYRD
jgi:hypothetical protein